MPIMPLFVLMPQAKAVADEAESVMTSSAECVWIRPVMGIFSIER